MKREYVKPVMESEEFVANEYIAACWAVTCVGKAQDSYHVISGLYIANDGLHTACGDVVTGLREKPSTYLKKIYNRGDLIRTEERSDSPQGYTYNGKEHWGVKVEERTTNEHPNASV